MKVWIVSVLLCAAFTLQITEGAAVISSQEAPEIPPENLSNISPGNIVENSPEEGVEISPENHPEISPEEAAEISPENHPEISPEEAAEISPENHPEISPEEAAEVYAEQVPDNSPELLPEISLEEAELAEHERHQNEPSAGDMAQGSDELDSVSGRSVLCPPGWFKHGARCFMLVRLAYTWLAAENHCANNQAILASVQNPSEYSFLQNLLEVSGHSIAWIGGYNFLNTWMWKDNAGFYYTNWQSLSSVSTSPCAYMRANGGWSNTNCASSYFFFCAVKPSTC